MTVSVIVPTYKRTDKLERALQSVKDQTFKELEVVVVDDNKSQKYREEVQNIVQEISEETDITFRIVVNEQNQGVSSARNLGINGSESKYIAFLDDDDEWKHEKIEKQIKRLEEENINAVYTASELYDGEVKDVVGKTQDLSLESILTRDRIGSPSKVLIEREWLEKVKGFDEDIPSGEDWDLWIRLIKEGCRFGYVDEPLTRYHKDNESKSKQKDIATEGRNKVTEKHSELLDKSGRKVKARHHLNRAKKQYQLQDHRGARKHLMKTIKNDPVSPEAYAMTAIYLTRKITGLDLIPLAADIKGKIR